jgi:hypothetical protein
LYVYKETVVRLLLLIILVTLLSCTVEKSSFMLDGKVIYSAQGLKVFNLRSKEVSVISETPFRLINYFDYVNDKNLLVSIFELNATPNRERIELWSKQGEVIREVALGSNAVYFEQFEKIVFNDKKGDLIISELNGGIETHILIEANNKFQNKPVLKTALDSFLYVKEIGGEYNIAEYSLTKKSSTIKIVFQNCSLDKSIWLSKKSALLCQERLRDGEISGSYKLVNINGEIEEMNFGVDGSWPLTSLEDEHYILLQQRTTDNFGTKEIHSVWVYDIESSQTHMIFDDLYMPSEVRQYKN